MKAEVAMKCKRSEGADVDGSAITTKRRRWMQTHGGVNSSSSVLSFRSLLLGAPTSLLLLLCVTSRASLSSSFTSPLGMKYHKSQKRLSVHSLSSTTSPTAEDSASSSKLSASSLPELYPFFSNTLASNGYVTPTPIQQSSASLAKDGENLLIIAATGSGKTLAYLLPVLSKACDGTSTEMTERRTVLIVAPTRELGAQLARDASLLLPDEVNEDGEVERPNVLLAVRGIPPPTPIQLAEATVLIGTANELYAVLTRISGAQNFLAGDTLSGLILDEVDVLLPPAPKTLRTTFDSNSAKGERKTLETRRKLRAAQRRGVEFHGGASIKGKSINSMDLTNSMNSQVLTPTERVLRLIASARYIGEEEDKLPLQVLAGSATASRSTLDRLNKALRWAAMEGGVIGGDGLEGVWRGRMQVCRPEAGDANEKQSSSTDPSADADDNGSTHTIRAVTVPSVVDHRYVNMSKKSVTNSHEILTNVASVVRKLEPKTSLVFICGEFSRSLSKEKKREAPKVTGNTSQARRNSKRRSVFLKKSNSKDKSANTASGPEPLSVRKACSVLQSMGVDAQPMHVALGLEPNAENGGVMPEEEQDYNPDDGEVELPPVLVTFEGSARGLHFDDVDIVFVVGRPTSAASYLHLAGRVGRAMAADDSDEGNEEVEIRPGTVVSFCSTGRVKELEKWTGQVGATELEEIEL